MQTAVSGFETEFEGRVEGQNLDATTPEAAQVVKNLGFDNHGLVVYSPSGDVLFKQKDHSVKIDEVRVKLSELIAH